MGMPYAGPNGIALTRIGSDYHRAETGLQSGETADIFSAAAMDFLRRGFDLCQRMKVQIRSDFSAIAIDNLKDPQADFIDPNLNLPTELLFVCHLFDEKDEKKVDPDADTYVSPHHFTPGSYGRAADRNGTWLILIDGSSTTEIGARHFVSPEHPESPYIDVTRALMERGTNFSQIAVVMHRDSAAKLGLT
jgi:hypothetical protein